MFTRVTFHSNMSSDVKLRMIVTYPRNISGLVGLLNATYLCDVFLRLRSAGYTSKNQTRLFTKARMEDKGKGQRERVRYDQHEASSSRK